MNADMKIKIFNHVYAMCLQEEMSLKVDGNKILIIIK